MDDIIDRLKAAAAQIKHCGDYCILSWNPNTRTVWLCMGDGDCPNEPEEHYSSMDEIKQLMTIDGVDHLIVEAEIDPPEDEEGWINLGRHGIEAPWL